jgi:hypothetical protein
MRNLSLAVAPDKHIRFSDSMVGLAGRIRKELSQPKTLDELSVALSRHDSGWPEKPTISQLALAASLLFAIDDIEIVDGDRIRKRQ